MPKKPTPGLPDVFARPGAAPDRGAELEPSEPMELPPPVVASPAVPTALVAMPQPAAVAVPLKAVAWIALAVSLTAPVWEGPVLGALGMPTPAARAELALAHQDAALAAATNRLETVSAQLAATRNCMSATIAAVQTLALQRLAEALRDGRPFGPELAILAATNPDASLEKSLAPLQPFAESGTPVLGELQHDLQDLARATPRPASQGLWTTLAAWTYVGTAKPPAGDADTGWIPAALARLSLADLPGAIELASQSPAADRTPVANWIARARARLAADAADDHIARLAPHPASCTL